MKARDQFKSLARATLAAVFVWLGAAGAARAATPNITGTGSVPGILDTETTRPFVSARLTDGDNDPVTLSISFPAAHGTLPTSSGFTRSGDVYTLTERSPLLATEFVTNLVFTPTLNSISIGSTRTTRFVLTLTDTGALFNEDNRTTLEVTPVNNPPTLSGVVPAIAIGDNETNQPFASVQIADVDNLGAQPVTLIVAIDKPTQGNFTNGTLSSFTLLSGNRYRFNGTPASATTAIQGLLFKPRQNQMPVGSSETTALTVTVADDGSPALSAPDATTQITATSINDVPAIGGVSTNAQPVRTGSSLTAFSNVSISDPDVNPDLTVTVTLQGASIIGEWNPSGSPPTTITLMNVTPAEASAAIQALIYSAPAFPLAFNTTNRMTAQVVVTDSSGGSQTNSRTTIEVYSPFTPPGLSGTQADQRVNDKNTLAPFSTVSIQSLNGGSFAVLVQLDDDAKGELINLSGFVKTAGTRARYTFTGASEAATIAIRQMLFRPTPNRLNGSATEIAVFEISLMDGGTTNGPDASTTVIVSPVNDRPLIQGVPPLIRITDNETTRPFRTVGISDIDERGTQSVHVVVTLDDAAKGTFDAASLGGFTSGPAGYSFEGSGALATLAISTLMFVPAENRVPLGESETTVFTITLDDGHGGTAVNNGTSVRVASVAGAPEIVVPMPQPISRPLTPPLYPFEAVTITDEDDLTVTVAILNTNLGTFTSDSLAATGFINSGPGTFTFHGTVDAVSNAIIRLDFAANTNLPPGVVNFSITALDTTGNSVTKPLSILLRIIQRVYVVTKTGDYDVGETDPNLVLGTLRKAIEDAGSNDHITFDLRPPTNGVPDLPATIRLRRTIPLVKSVTIDGPGANLLTISGDIDDNGSPDVQLFQVSANARLNRLMLTKGNAGFAGGAVAVLPGGNLTLSYCAVTDNQAEQWGGGIDVDAGGLQMDHCLISSNRTIAAVGQGGGGVSIFSDQHCVIENTTFSGNSQQSPGGLGGGGLYVENLDPATPLLVYVNGCTFRDNRDEAGGGTSIQPNVFNSQVLLKNTIVADGHGGNLNVDESGLIVSFGGNISDDSTRTVFSFGGAPYEIILFEPPADKTNVAPQLGPLAVNSGQTLTHALDFNSPALAAAVANTLGTDQRGYWRDTAPDSGAFERGARRAIIINEIAFDPAPPAVNNEFIEFYVPRAATNVDVGGLQLWIGGELRHTFTPQALEPGQGIVVFSKDATPNTVPVGVYRQVSSTNLLLSNGADTITVKDPAGLVVLEVTYIGSYTSSDTTATNLFTPHQSLTLVPEFTGVLLPYQRAVEKVIGITPSPDIRSSPGTEIGGKSLAGGNAPPIAFDDMLSTDEDTALVIDVLGNDVELDGNDFLHILTAPLSSALGAAVTGTPTNIVYDPTVSPALRSLPVGSNRVDSFIYTLIDCCDPVTHTNWPTATGGRYTATNYITVTGVNDAPTPQADSVANSPRLLTFEDGILEINVVSDLLPNDTDPDTDDNNTTLEPAAVHLSSTYEDTFETVSQLGAVVTLELRFNRNEARIIYDPIDSAILHALEQGQVTNDVFYFSVIDRHGAIGVSEVRIQVTGKNDLPTATADTLATDEDTVLTVPVAALLGNDTDPDTDDNLTTLATLRVTRINGATSLVSTTGFGARIAISGGNVIYDPTISAALNALARKEVLVDRFDYTAADNFGGSSTTTVQIAVTGVNDTPVSAPDIGTVGEDTIALVPTPGVLANDIDFDVNGTAPDDRLRVLAATNALTAQGARFSINADGSYSFDPRGTFDYLKQDQLTNDVFSYTVVDDSYTIANDDEFSVTADSINSVLAVLVNDVTLTGTGGRLLVVSIGAASNGGTVTTNATGTALVYTPQINFFGEESFQYGIEDGQGGHDTATVRVKVTVPVRNGNLVANIDRFTVARGTSPILDVLANDNILPSGGDVIEVTALGSTDRSGTVTLTAAGPNNAVLYTPAPNALLFPYTETFNYTVSGGGIALATGTVVITVLNRQGILPVNDDVFTVVAGASSSSFDVLANDRVVPGTTTNLVITGVEANGVSGVIAVNSNGTRLLYTPPVGSISHVEPVFHYFITDGSGGTATGAVAVTVMQAGLNANDDFYVVARNSTNTLLVLANDNALPNVGQNLLVTTIGLSNNVPNRGGVASVSANGRSIAYTPSPTNSTGEETFTYEITDGTLERAQGRVKVKILDRTGAVNVNGDTFSVVRDSTNNLLHVLRNDNLLPDTRERLTITAVGAPTRGGNARLVGTAPNQSVLYAPRRGFVGDEDFTYSVVDNRGGNGTASVRVRVGHLIAEDDLFTVLSDTAGNALDVLYNDRLLPDGTPNRNVISVGATDKGGTVAVSNDGVTLLYRPAPSFTGRESFSYVVEDDSGNQFTGRATVSVLPAGGDRDTTTVTITVVGVNDPPTIAGTGSAGTITDKQTIHPFPTVVIGEVDDFGQQILTVTVTFEAGHGLLTELGSFAQSGPAAYTFVGTAPQATAALRMLVYDPIENRITVPTSELTTFSISVHDGFVSQPVIDSATTLTVSAVNDPPIISGTVANQTVYHRLTIKPFSSVTITEVDDLTLQPLVITVALNAATNGFLSSLGGFVDLGGGVYRLGTTGSGVTAATASETLRTLVFNPTTGDRVTPGSPETTQFTITVEDGFAAPVVDTNATVIAIHEYVTKLLASDGATTDQFGAAVAASVNVVVVGATQDDDRGNNSGAAYIFTNASGLSTQWVQFQKLVPLDLGAGHEFGNAVAISGNTIAVGAHFGGAAPSPGAVYIFQRGPTNWGQVQKLTPFDGANGDEFGFSISMDKDTLVVGARSDDDNGTSSGVAFVYARTNATNWSFVKKLIRNDPAAGDEFGRSVSVHADTIIVGAHLDVTNSASIGSAYLFGRNVGGTTNWGQIKKLVPSDGLGTDGFGFSVGIFGDTAVVGSRQHDHVGNDTGSAYLFKRDQGGANSWGELKEIASPTALNNDQFGYAVSIDRDKFVGGLPFSGFDNQSKYGAAFAFAQNLGGSDNWGVVQRLDRPDAGNNDQFGLSVNIGQGLVAVGVNFDDDRGNDSGSVYIYRLKYNNAPRLVTPIPNQTASTNTPFTFTLPADTFGDADVGDMLALSATLSDGSPLPVWLSFSPTTGNFSGTPSLATDYAIRVTATDEDGAVVTATFNLAVSSSGNMGAPLAIPMYLSIAEDLETGQTVLSYERISNGPSALGRTISTRRLSYLLETSTDLLNWTAADLFVASEAITPVDELLEHVTLRVQRSAPAQFFRIKCVAE